MSLVAEARMAVLSELALGVAHTLNNALTSIGGEASFLQSETKDPEVEQACGLILEQVERCARLTHALLRRRSPPPAACECELGRVLRDVQALLRDSLPRRLELSIEACDEPILLALPADEAETIVLLLVQHAALRLAGAGALRLRLPEAGPGLPAVLELRDGGGGAARRRGRAPRAPAPRAGFGPRRLRDARRLGRGGKRAGELAAPRGVTAMRRPKGAAHSQRPWSIPRGRAGELPAIGALILSVVLGLLAITGFGLVALESVRGYVTGEGLYSKAQKAAIYQLARYAETGAELFYQRYEEAIALPRADAEARIALEAPEPDLPAAVDAFLRGRNHPEDVPNMVRLFRAASWLPEMAHAIEIWRAGDRQVDEIVAIAADIRAEVQGARSPERIAALLARLDVVDDRLTELESAFSFTLGAGSRRVQRIIFGGAVGSGLLFFVIALFTAARWLARQRRTERLYRSLTEDAHDIVNLIDREGMLRYVSPAAERALGWRPEELIDRSALELIHPEDARGVASTIGHALANPHQSVSAEFRFRHRDGSWRTFESTGRVLPTTGGSPLLIVVSRDATERRELEARLREAQKMESLGRLAGGVAHDFNNLLTAILGSVELLKNELPEGSRERAELDEIASSGERAARLTSQLLAFARRQPIALRVVDLATLVRGMEGLLRRLLRDEIVLELEAGPGPATVRGAAEQLEQVVVNLVVNARDALEHGGRITVATGRAGEWVQLSVSDTGAGMSEEVQRRAFEPFFTTKPPGQGTGLGLATCYGIVEQSGGTIVADSAPGRGTTVRILLPFAPAEPAAIEAPAREPRRERRGTVLLVEDEPAVRRIAMLALRRAGHLVLEAADAPAALRIAEDGAVELDLLVTDVVMPGMGGRALAARLREQRPDLPVLFVSGYTEDEALRREIAALRAAFLPKPFTPDTLRAKVEELLDAGKPSEAD